MCTGDQKPVTDRADMLNRKAFDLLMKAIKMCTSNEYNEIKAGLKCAYYY